MLVRALGRKLLRDVSRMRGQIATIALVLACGITSFLALRGTYASLEAARASYYDRQRFADVFVTLERAPESLAARVEALPGVARVETRIAEEVTLPIAGMARPAYGHVLSLPPSRAPATNAPVLQRGRFPERGRDDEVVVLASFAEAHGLGPGDHVSVVVNGKLRELRVVGVALSPEYVYAIRPGALADDPQRYAVLWMDRRALAAAFQLEGAFNDLSLRLQPGSPGERDATERATRAALDELHVPYGGQGAVGAKDQLSNKILTGELQQLEVLAGWCRSSSSASPRSSSTSFCRASSRSSAPRSRR